MDNYMKLEIPALGKNESFARNVIAAFALECAPTVEEINDVKTAVSEAVTNAVVHAYEGGNGMIEIIAEIEDKTLSVRVTDYGVGIADMDEAKEPFFTTKPDEERSGMGFTIIETFMDEMSLQSEAGRGTTVTMKKKFGKS